MKLKKILTYILIITLFSGMCIFSETDNDSDHSQEYKIKDDKFFRSLFKDEGLIWTSPFRFSATDWLYTIGILGITGYMIANDESIYDRFKAYQNKNEWVSDLSPTLTLLGDGNVNLGITGLFFLTGAIFKDEKSKDTAKLLLMSLIHSGIVVQLGKHLAGRQRPEAENGVDKWAGPSGFFKRYKNSADMFYDAFPSGHTITAWATATVIAHQYNKNFIVPFLSYSLATLAGISRITEDKHWLSDVFFGAVLGFAIGKFVYRKRSGKFLLSPYISGDKYGVNIGFKL
ncbi:MAG: phosphatase PAP2 family protein [Acidobacteriota bacterium]